MTTVEVLRKARAFIEDPAHWWQEQSYGDREENCVCAAGAIYLAVNGWGPATPRLTTTDETYAAVEALAHQTAQQTVFDFNDSPETSHADVLAAFDRAIESEERAA